jgi:putative oxidoreductase
MRIVRTIARLLLGLVFVVFGLNGFLNFIPAPPMGGSAGAFFGAMAETHYSVLVFGVQILAGVMLLTNLFVPLALVLLGAVLANILTFHLTMYPSGFQIALFVTVLWFIVALPLRSHFAPLFVRRARRR